MENKINTAVFEKKGNGFVGITYIGIVRMKKTGNPLIGHDVVKIVNANYAFGNSYANSVSNRASKEQGEKVKYESDGLRGFEWVNYPYILKSINSGELYVRFYMKAGATPTTAYFVDGEPATKEQIDIINIFKEKSGGFCHKQAEAGCIENQVKPLNIKLANIVCLTMDGETYVNPARIEVVEKASIGA